MTNKFFTKNSEILDFAMPFNDLESKTIREIYGDFAQRQKIKPSSATSIKFAEWINWLEKPVSLYKEADADEELFEVTGGSNFAIYDIYDFDTWNAGSSIEVTVRT